MTKPKAWNMTMIRKIKKAVGAQTLMVLLMPKKVMMGQQESAFWEPYKSYSGSNSSKDAKDILY